MLNRATMIGYRSGLYTDDELLVAFEMITDAGAKALRLDGYGLRVGARADFVTLNTAHVQAAVASPPQGRSVYKEGKLIAERQSAQKGSSILTLNVQDDRHWWARQDSNLQPDRYERPALTIELQAPPRATASSRSATVPAPFTG
jgi:adenine deaminase